MIHRKTTAVNSLLKYESSHPRKLVQSIPIGQFLRIRRICSTEQDFEKQADELKTRFRDRGYSEKWIRSAYWRAKHSKRETLLQHKRTLKKDNRVRFITKFHAQTDAIHEILKKYWSILPLDPILKLYVQKYPSVTYRRATNLKDILVRSHHRGTRPERAFGGKGPKWGCKTCGRCVACTNIESTNVFFDSQGKEYKITHTITCNTIGIIYHGTCGLIYIGLTTRELRRRVREHVLGILAAANEEDKEKHGCDPTGFRIILGMSGVLFIFTHLTFAWWFVRAARNTKRTFMRIISCRAFPDCERMQSARWLMTSSAGSVQPSGSVCARPSAAQESYTTQTDCAGAASSPEWIIMCPRNPSIPAPVLSH
ncbi:uncharacterized protein LOC130358228 isoform X1 [Hyla sarda]|uniref:uncharacterized protein LOC130358228 isoform X1 n=1 Tax=Hyla sarda TaxID=327740 RepID=UPI0024C38686|nr:uncharacterized protein LOC130358228 isoform X1 [Hyla sarda]XP_056417129.1 uncharacterized protein LOC130358228 isoform X1 [Hyla sarda]XP_056417130.1 uncharacterized protein LOC130358228 isoform X1 [Hyla sarda]